MAHTIIIGNGIAGTSTARNLRKHDSKAQISIVSSETEHFYSRTALMYIYMGHMRFKDTKPYADDFWTKNRIDLVFDHVTQVDFEAKQVHLRSGGSMSYDNLVFAVGSTPNKFGWPGQDLPGVQGLYSYQDLETLEANTAPFGKPQPLKRAVIIGGGLIGIELAEMLLTRNIPVTFLVRESHFWGGVLPKEESELIMHHMRKHHVDLRLNTELDAIIPDENGRASAVKTKDGETIECQLVGLTAGVRPNIAAWSDTALECERGIIVDDYLQTNLEGVYAAGDCVQLRTPQAGRRPIEAVWYVGRMMGECLGATLAGKKTAYRPGHWFNSAKFFDIEYQTYGKVLPKLEEDEARFYWEHPNGERCIHIQYRPSDERFLGVNVFGIRWRHEVLDRWLEQHFTVSQVMEHARDAQFDPELYEDYMPMWHSAYENHFGKKVSVKKKSWKRILGITTH